MKTRSKCLALALVTLLWSSCGKMESTDLLWNRLSSGTNSQLNDIYFTDAQNGVALGGSTWFLGQQLQTRDGGQSWTVDSLWRAELQALSNGPDGRLYAVGIGGRVFQKSNNRDWQTAKLIPVAIHRDLCVGPSGRTLIVSGEAFQDGRLLVYSPQWDLLHQDSFEFELSAVCFSDDSTAHIGGYGALLRSTDAGLTWAFRDMDGDFFQSIHFPTADVGYAVGLLGTIAKTTDGGRTWFKQRDGRKLSQSDVPFRSVFFVNPQKGYIVGDDQTFWKTEDGGEVWKKIASPPPGDLKAIQVVDGKGFIVGSGGGIYTFTDE
ncbi:MAG: YCF48-related protein [Bacteroidota bacterium]